MNNEGHNRINVEVMSIENPIDTNFPLEHLGFSKARFFEFLMNFEDLTLIQSLAAAKKALEDRDNKNLKESIHTIKGACSYIGASRLHYSCYFMQYYYEKGRYRKMHQFYPMLIEASVEFRIISRQLYNQFKGTYHFSNKSLF